MEPERGRQSDGVTKQPVEFNGRDRGVQAVVAETLPAWLASEATGQLGLRSFPSREGGERARKRVLLVSDGKLAHAFEAGATIGSGCDGEIGEKPTEKIVFCCIVVV